MKHGNPWYSLNDLYFSQINKTLEGKNMAKWFIFDIMKITHLTLYKIIAIIIMIKI
jgi:hypothetical protein